MSNFMDRLKLSYNILTKKEAWVKVDQDNQITSSNPSSMNSRISYDTSKTVIAPIINRISIDGAAIPMRHVKVDEFRQYKETVDSELNDRLTIRANMDQSGTAFVQDAIGTMLTFGACALVPVEVSANPAHGSFDILSLRVGSIDQWYNKSVQVSVYNELTGDREQKVLPKEFVAIAYNPMSAVMNESNSTLRRLIDRLALLDRADGKLFSPQLDLIIQLPYSLKSDRRQAEADRRLEILQAQLDDSKYGIAYLDATEKVTQLNRPVTNDLVTTVVTLTETLHAQLGLTPSIFSGTASAEEMVYYNNRTILPIVNALAEAMLGSFFTRTAIRQGNTVMAFPSLFKMVPLIDFANAADKLTRNEIMTSNEVRAVVGLAPSVDPEADKLRNKNLNKQGDPSTEEAVEPQSDDKEKE